MRALAGVRLPFVQYVASLAVVHAIQEQARARLGVRHAHSHRSGLADSWPMKMLVAYTLPHA